MSVQTQTADLIRLDGALDGEGATGLRDRFTALAAAGRSVVLDMTNVSSIDGAGIGAIAFLFRRLASVGAGVRVVGAAGQTRLHLLDLGLAPVFGVPVRRRRRPANAPMRAA
jgi:anti-anti-sigma factor